MENPDNIHPQPAEIPPEPPLAPETPTEPPAPVIAEEKPDKPVKPPLPKRLYGWITSHKKWSIPAGVVILAVILGLIPWSRYKAAGLVLKRDVTVKVLDSRLLKPVSGATVSYGSITAKTGVDGKATLHHIKVGNAAISVTKKYYQDGVIHLLVPITQSKNSPEVQLVATGRPIPVKVIDFISGKPVSGANIGVSGTTAQTDSAGNAIVVVPTGLDIQQATVSQSGYNDATFYVHPNAHDAGSELQISMVPAGQIYYLSKATGKLNLMKSNLDGSKPEVVLPGTGYEQDSNSSISISPDGNYVALTLQRSASDSNAQLYIMSSADDKLLSVDSGKADFLIEGWWGDNLIYSSSRTDLPDWQTGKNKLKSYDATTGKLTLLDQSSGVNDSTGAAGETYGFVAVINGNVLYAKNWTVDSGAPAATDTLSSIGVGGQNHKAIASYDGSKYTMSYAQHAVNSIYIWQQDTNNYNDNGTFFDYRVGQATPSQVNINSSTFYSSPQTFLPSASGDKVLWSDYRDGKNEVLVSNYDGSGETNTVTPDGYSPYGWYTDKYVLVTSNSTLYIVGSGGGTVHSIASYQITGY